MRSKLLLMLAASATAGFCLQLQAEQQDIKNEQSVANEQKIKDDELNNNKENRLTVTATRQESLDTDLAMSVHSVNEKTMAIDNGQHPAESLNSLAGVYIDQLSGGQGHKAAIRMPINTDGYYLYLQDNIPIQSAAFFNHNGLWWSSFNSGVNRIEVLKGAGTALHGSGAVAATINILSKPVNFEGDTSIGATFAEDGYQKVQMSNSNKIDETSGYRVSASHFSNDGWREQTASERSEINFSHELGLDKNSSLKTLFVGSNLEQQMAGALTETQYQMDPAQSGLSDAVLAVEPLRKSHYIRLSTQWDKFSDANSYSLIPYLRQQTNQYTATWNKNMPAVDTTVSSFGVLALANFSHSDDAQTSMGFDLEITEGKQYSYQPYAITTSGWGSDTFNLGEIFYQDKTRYSGLSPYLQHKRQLMTDIDLTIGARYDYAKYNFDNQLDQLGDIGHGNLSLADRDDQFNHFSPKASLNYHLNQESSVFLRYANSFRLPTADSLYHLKTTESDEGISRLKPEVSDTYELGYKTNLDNLSFDFAIYYMDVDQGIIHAENENGQRYLVNATRVIHKGFEMTTDWQIITELNLNLAYTRSKHLFDQYNEFMTNDLSGNDLSDKEMMSAPKDIINLRLNYQPNWLDDLTTQLEFQSLGDYWLDNDNSAKYQGFSLLNFKAKYQVNKNLSLNARLLNTANKEYVQSAAISYGNVKVSPGTPRTFYFGVNYQW